MENLEYLRKFFEKHGFSGTIRLLFPGDDHDEQSITRIEFPGGLEIGMNDIIYDIESGLPDGMMKEWMKDKEGVGFAEWSRIHSFFVPENIDMSSVCGYRKDMERIVGEMRDAVGKAFGEKGGEPEQVNRDNPVA